MMHKHFFLYVSTLLIFLCSKSIKAENYIEYNLEILNAQHFLINNSFDSALISYKSAFSMVAKPFPKDYRNAALTAYNTDSIALMKDYLEKAVINGYHFKFSFKHFIKNSFGFYFKKDRTFLKYLENKCVEVIMIDFQNPVYAKYKELFELDQDARKGISNKRQHDKMKKSDDVIYAELIKDGINNGFYPGYITAGTYEYSDLSFAFMMHVALDRFEMIIIQALTKGEISPCEAAVIYTRQFVVHHNGCRPTSFPEEIKDTNLRYEGERYSKLREMGFDFHRMI